MDQIGQAPTEHLEKASVEAFGQIVLQIVKLQNGELQKGELQNGELQESEKRNGELQKVEFPMVE